MNKKEKIIDYITDNNGMITTKELKKLGIDRKYVSDLVKDGKLVRMDRGIYVNEFSWIDDYFVTQYRLQSGIYSHETALFLLGYANEPITQTTMTFPYGHHSTRPKRLGVRPVFVSHYYDHGIVEVERPGGRTARVYSIERTLIDLLRPHYQADKRYFFDALQDYLKSRQCHLELLLKYARMFSVEEKLQDFLDLLQ